jgi:hypothetical protein
LGAFAAFECRWFGLDKSIVFVGQAEVEGVVLRKTSAMESELDLAGLKGAMEFRRLGFDEAR